MSKSSTKQRQGSESTKRQDAILIDMESVTLRWGSQVPDDAGAARTRLVEMAELCFNQKGILQTSIEDIARAAQVSRATVYRYFDGRDDLVLAVILRTADRYLNRIRPHVDEFDSLADVVVEWIVRTERAARRDASLSLLFNVEGARVTGSIIAGSSVALFERVTEFFRPYFERFDDEVRQEVDVQTASEWILRMLLSLLTVEGPRRRSQDGERLLLRTYLVPAICNMD